MQPLAPFALMLLAVQGQVIWADELRDHPVRTAR